MRRLVVVFVVFVALGALVAGFGLWLAAARGGGSALPGSALLLTYRLEGELPDHDGERPFPLPGSQPAPSLSRLWTALAAARADDRVVGLALEIRDASLGLAKAEELRRQIAAFAAAGKRVDCYLESAGEGGNGTLEYFLASACPSISLAPAGEVALLGLYADSLFLRGTFDKLKVEPSFLTAGRFKSAAETFTERAHSPAAREALDALLDAYFAQIVDGVASGRSLPADAVRALVDRGPLSADEALAAGLIDTIAYPDQFDAGLEKSSGDAERLDLLDYGRRHDRARPGGERIAVVFAEGTIVRARAVLAAGVVLTRSSRVFDLVKERELVAGADEPLEIPAGAVVVAGSRPASGEFARTRGLQVAAPMIVKYRDEKTDAKATLEDALRQ